MLEKLGWPTIEVEGRFGALERGLQVEHPQWMVPDDVVEYCARRWKLVGKIGMDLFAGYGSIPDAINRMGGYCEANELDPQRCDIIEQRVPPGTLVRQGDYREAYTPSLSEGWDYLYLSFPFDELYSDEPDRDLDVFLYSILDDDGELYIDSAVEAIRDGVTRYPALATITYLYDLFHLEEALNFRLTDPPEWCDPSFAQLRFSKKPLNRTSLIP